MFPFSFYQKQKGGDEVLVESELYFSFYNSFDVL